MAEPHGVSRIGEARNLRGLIAAEYVSNSERRLSAQRALMSLFCTRAIGTFGVVLHLCGMAWLTIELGGSSLEIGLLTGTMLAPLLVVAVAGGVLADRLPRHWLAHVVEIVRMLAMLVVPVLVIFVELHLWHLYVQAAVIGACRAIAEPTTGGLLAHLSKEAADDTGGSVSSSNAKWQLVTQLSVIAANLTFGFVLSAASPVAAFTWGAVAHFVAALLVLTASTGLTAQRVTSKKSRRTLRQDLAEMRTVLADNPAAQRIAVLAGLPLALLVACNVLLAPLVAEALNGDEAGYAMIAASLATGALCAALLCLRLGARTLNLAWHFAAHLVVAAAVAAFAMAPNVATATVLVFPMGFAASFANVIHPAFLQHAVPDAVVGRVLSVVQAAMSALALVFAVGAGLIGHVVSARVGFGTWAGLFVVSAALLVSVAPRHRPTVLAPVMVGRSQ